MADTMQFDLVSPERALASVQAASVKIPGADGDMTVMPNHASTITTLRPGVLRVEAAEGTTEYVVTGGFAEISAAGVTVLAERSMAKGDMTAEDMASLVEDARAALNDAKEFFENEPGPVDDAAKMLADMVAMGDEMGIGSK